MTKKHKPKWKKTDFPSEICKVLYGIILREPTYKEFEIACGRSAEFKEVLDAREEVLKALGKAQEDRQFLVSEDTWKKLRQEMQEMPLHEIEALEDETLIKRILEIRPDPRGEWEWTPAKKTQPKVADIIDVWIDQLWVPLPEDLPDAWGDVGYRSTWIAGREFAWEVNADYSVECPCPIEKEDRFNVIRSYLSPEDGIWNIYERWKKKAGDYFKLGHQFTRTKWENELNEDWENVPPIKLLERVEEMNSELADLRIELINRLQSLKDSLLPSGGGK